MEHHFIEVLLTSTIVAAGISAFVTIYKINKGFIVKWNATAKKLEIHLFNIKSFVLVLFI